MSVMEGVYQNKQKLKMNSESSNKEKDYHSSTIEQLCLRFPLIEDKILNELEYHSLIKFTAASKEMADIQQRSRFFWIRRIQYQLGSLYIGHNDSKDWRKVIKKSPVEIVRELSKNIQQFYTFSTKNKYCIVKCSPMHIAAERSNLKLCQHIIDRIEDKNPKDSFGETPFHWAAEEGNFDVCKIIIQNATDKNPEDMDGITPLHRAAGSGHNKIWRMIFEKVKDKNPGDLHGSTPLHYAARNGHFESYKMLVENVGIINPADNFGNTPLDEALYHGHLDVCKLIESMVELTLEERSHLAHHLNHENHEFTGCLICI